MAYGSINAFEPQNPNDPSELQFYMIMILLTDTVVKEKQPLFKREQICMNHSFPDTWLLYTPSLKGLLLPCYWALVEIDIGL